MRIFLIYRMILNMATASDLPKEFDVIVLGTGMPESIVAAAFSRIGQSVLHLDRNDHYSGNWASFNLQGIEKWAQQHQDITNCKDDLERPAIDESSLLEDGEKLIQLPLGSTSFSHTETKYYVQEQDEEDEKQLREETESVVDNSDKEATRTENELVAANNDDKEDSSISVDEEKEKTFELKSGSDIHEQEDNKEPGDKDSQLETKADSAKTDDKPEGNKESLCKPNDENLKNTTENVVSCEASEKDATKPWTQKRLKADWRRFNMDLSPKVLYSVGDMVELLISSDIAKYCEFKTVTQVLTILDGNLEKVPCSRADVFSSKKVSMLEKRMLMKFLQFCLEYDKNPEEIEDFMDKPFVEFLTSRKLTATIKHYIQHSIAMATDSMTTAEGLTRMKKFLSSLGRYGNTAFLWSLYGSGELPQSFCRMCAVFGGVYCLRMSASSIIMESENKCTAIISTEGQRIKCKWLVMESSYAPTNFLIMETTEKRLMSRAIIMTDRPLLTTGQQEQLSVMCLPCPDDGDRPVRVLELPPSSMASPSGVYICHLTRLSKHGLKPKDDLLYVVESLFSQEMRTEDKKPKLLWSLYFTQEDTSQVVASSTIPENVILMSGPGTAIDIDNTVQEAKDVFKRILPEEEFLPKAPNPEDIIYVDDTEAQVADADSQSEFSKTDQSRSETQEGKQDDQSEVSKTDQSGTEVQGEKLEDPSECEKQEDASSDSTSDKTTETDEKSEITEQKAETSPADVNVVESSFSEMDIKKDGANEG